MILQAAAGSGSHRASRIDAMGKHSGELYRLPPGDIAAHVDRPQVSSSQTGTFLAPSRPGWSHIKPPSRGQIRLTESDPHAPTGLYVKDPSEGSTRVHYYRSGSAASHMAADLTATLPIEDVLLVHLTGITPGLSRSCADLIDAVVERVRGTSALLSFDVNYRPGLWPVGTAAPVLARLANGANIVLVGLDEAKALWGTATPAQVRELLPQPSRLVVKSGGRRD